MRSILVCSLFAVLLSNGMPPASAQDAASSAQEGRRGGMGFARQPMVHGTVTAVAADKLTIKTDAGDLYTVAVTPNTRLLKENRLPGAAPTDGPRQPQLIKIEEIKPGDGIGATGELDAPNKTLHALFVAVMDAAQVKRLREGMGKEYITGKVTAMDETKLTIQRADNVTQVIEVDETTSFRRGGRRAVVRADGSTSPLPSGPQDTMQGSGNESITLADLKVGDMIAGQGSLKHGVFVPTTLTVVPPGAMGGPRMRREGQPPVGAAAPAQTAPNQ